MTVLLELGTVTACGAQFFAAEVKGPRDGAEERPRGAFGQELPRPLPSAADSAAVAGALQVESNTATR
jgi:hypothetical protein